MRSRKDAMASERLSLTINVRTCSPIGPVSSASEAMKVARDFGVREVSRVAGFQDPDVSRIPSAPLRRGVIGANARLYGYRARSFYLVWASLRGRVLPGTEEELSSGPLGGFGLRLSIYCHCDVCFGGGYGVHQGVSSMRSIDMSGAPVTIAEQIEGYLRTGSVARRCTSRTSAPRKSSRAQRDLSKKSFPGHADHQGSEVLIRTDAS